MSPVSELESLLGQAMARVRDPRRVWLQSSVRFESRIEFARGLVLGGAHSPQYLPASSGGGPGFPVPNTAWLASPRVMVCPQPPSAFQSWIPLLEALTKSPDSLLLVLPRLESEELLSTLVVNHVRQAIRCCAVLPDPDAAPDLKALAQAVDALDGRPASVPRANSHVGPGEPFAAGLLDRLPRAAQTALRRRCSVVIPSPNSPGAAALPEIAILHVGGDDVEDQKECLLFLDGQIRLLESQGSS